MTRMWRSLSVGCALTALSLGTARADLVLSGPTSTAGSYSTAELQSAASAGDMVSSGGLTGISLWGLLGGAASSSPFAPVYGDITTSTPAGLNNKNAILRYYLAATSATGQVSVISLGEIDPSFGGTQSTPAFIAYGQTGGGLLATPELEVPGYTGRGLTDITHLALLAVPAITGPGGQSTAVTLSGNVKNPGSYDLAALESFPSEQVPTTGPSVTYTGTQLGAFIDPSVSDIASQLVVTQGTDGYEVVISLAEVDTADGGSANDILAYASNGTDFPGSGVARTIYPDDSKHGRWMSNMDEIDVFSVPEPASLPILLAGVAGLLLVVRRRDAGLAEPRRNQ
jgi:hypothetical protein